MINDEGTSIYQMMGEALSHQVNLFFASFNSFFAQIHPLAYVAVVVAALLYLLARADIIAIAETSTDKSQNDVR